MSTREFMEGIKELLSLQDLEEKDSNNNMAIMCAEALPWRCHRRLVSDYLVAVMNIEIYNAFYIMNTICL